MGLFLLYLFFKETSLCCLQNGQTEHFVIHSLQIVLSLQHSEYLPKFTV